MVLLQTIPLLILCIVYNCPQAIFLPAIHFKHKSYEDSLAARFFVDCFIFVRFWFSWSKKKLLINSSYYFGQTKLTLPDSAIPIVQERE